MTAESHDAVRARSRPEAATVSVWQARPSAYWPFVIPGLVTVVAVIVIPWMFTLWMSLHEWKLGGTYTFVGADNYLRLPKDPRFVDAVWRTLVYSGLAVILPVILGTLAALVFHNEFRGRGILRGAFVAPMMATPVAIPTRRPVNLAMSLKTS